MREIEFLHYRPGRGIWHRHDPRLKLLETALWTVLALAGHPVVLASVLPAVLVPLVLSGIRLKSLARPLAFWAVMAAAIVLAGGLSTSGAPLALFGRPLGLFGLTLPLSGPGLLGGTLRAVRLLAVLLAGQLLASTTDPFDLSAALRSLTAFLPASWSAALATAMSLTIALLPVLMDEAATVRDAALCRGLGLRRSIVRRAAVLSLPMAESALRRAETTADALLSRCLDARPTPPGLRIRPIDLALTAAVLAPAAVTAVLAAM